MTTRSGIELILDTCGIEELQGGETILIGDILRVALGEHELTHVLLDTISGFVHALTITFELLCLGREPA